MNHHFDTDKCEWCGSEALLMSVLMGGEWMKLCNECYSLMVVDSEEEYGPIPGYDEDDFREYPEPIVSATECEDIEMR